MKVVVAIGAEGAPRHRLREWVERLAPKDASVLAFCPGSPTRPWLNRLRATIPGDADIMLLGYGAAGHKVIAALPTYRGLSVAIRLSDPPPETLESIRSAAVSDPLASIELVVSRFAPDRIETTGLSGVTIYERRAISSAWWLDNGLRGR